MRAWLAIFVAFCVAWFADAATKSWALSHTKAQILVIVPGVVSALVPPMQNLSAGNLVPGVALKGFRESSSIAAIVVSLLLVLAALAWIGLIEKREEPGRKLTLLEQIGFGVLFAGTIGNVLDRVLKGGVIDFLSTPLWDVMLWNVADVEISLGLFIVGIEAIRLGRLSPTRLWKAQRTD